VLGKNTIERITFAAAANVGAVDAIIFSADADYELMQVDEVHETAGSDGGAVTLDVVKLTGTTAIASGATMLQTPFNLKSTARVIVRKNRSQGGLTTSVANRWVTRGDRIGLNFTGTTTALVGLLVQVWLKRHKKRLW